ncbi:unnamed protein product, partial [Adineta steineri]
MRLCNALIHYFLFTIFLSLCISNCYGHEHHNHVDPVTAKYSQSAVTIDPLSTNIETANIHKNHDDEHLQDTIDARLRTKHDLRQSVHQHSDDDDDHIHENEEDYINRLNSALEDNYGNEFQFEQVAPPLADPINNIQLQNQTKEDVKIPPHIHKETTSTLSPSIQIPSEQKQYINDELQLTEKPHIIENQKYNQNIDENSNPNVVVDEIISSRHLQTDEQELTDTYPQKIIKEDILYLNSETISSTKSHQTVEIPSHTKSAPDSIPSTPIQHPPISNTIKSETSKDDISIDIKPSSPTPLQSQEIKYETKQNMNSFDRHSDVLHQTPEVIVNDNSLHLNSESQRISDSIHIISSIDENLPSSTPSKRNHEHQQITDSIQNVSAPEQQQEIPSVHIDQQASQVNDRRSDDIQPIQQKESLNSAQIPSSSPTTPTTRILRSASSRMHQKVHTRHRHGQSDQEPIKTQSQTENISSTENINIEPTVSSTTITVTEQPTETIQPPTIDFNINNKAETQRINEIETQTNDENVTDIDNIPETHIDNQNSKPFDTTDLPRQVHVHDPTVVLNELKQELNQNEDLSLDQEVENSTTVDSFLVNDHSPHLPRIHETEETITHLTPTIEETNEKNSHDSKTDELTLKSNNSDKMLPIEYRQVCWQLPKPFESTFGIVENKLLGFINLLPEYIQSIFFGASNDREKLMNTMWFSFICSICFFCSFIFLSMGAKRLKQSKNDKEIRARCQQLQQYNNQIELERATFERQNQKLSDEIDELKNLPIRDTDEEIFELREKYERLHADWQISRTEHDTLLRDNDYRQSLIQKHEFDMQKQVENAATLNDENLRLKQELEKERETIARLQSNDLSLERFEKLQETIQLLKSEISQLKQDKFTQTDQLQQLQEQANQLDIDNNQLTIKMKQLKDLIEQKDETITRMREKLLNTHDDDEDETTEKDDLLSKVSLEENVDNNSQELLSNIDNDVEKANQHMRDLHSEIDEKTRRIKELDLLLNQEKDRSREVETKLKVVLELRERDAHLHIRQLGQTDAELRKARTDTERVRILQQQLQLKEQQLEDVQKVLNSEQTKFSEECSKLQHETHEKWMEVKRLGRELDGARKECEGLRRQITKYGNSERSSQEKTMYKPVPQHLSNNTGGRVSSDPETNGSSPPIPNQQGDIPIGHERNDSGAASPSEMFRIRPPLFTMQRPPFFPPPFMPPPPPNPFMMGARFPMPPMGGPHGLISPIPHIMTNGSGAG